MADNFFKIKNGTNLGNLSSDPSNGTTGDVYYNTSLNKLREYVNGAWRDAVTADDIQSITNKQVSYSSSNDATATGANTTLTAFTTGIIRLINGSLTSFSGIPAGNSGQYVIIENKTGNQITVNNEEVTATAANRVLTGTNSNISMPNNATFAFTYDITSARWQLTGGSGSGSGSGGINLLVLDSTYLPTQSTNADFEATVGDWLAYADAAGTTPVDMTGGSPDSTFTRTTSTALNGLASGLFTVNSGASRQGEGFSKLTYIPPGYRSRTMPFAFPYETTGTIVEDDFRLVAYQVDGANPRVLDVFSASKIIGAKGVAIGLVTPDLDATQVRVGVHVARTSTDAFTLKLDDVTFGPQTAVNGVAATNWTSYTPSGSWVTNTTYYGAWTRVGPNLTGRVSVLLSGAPTATGLTFTQAQLLPSGLSLDTSALPNHGTVAGTNYDQQVGTCILGDVGGGEYLGPVYWDGNANIFRVKSATGSPNPNVSSTSPFTFGSQDQITILFEVPILGWSSNVSMGESSTLKVSSFLAAGTRVTGTAPTKLGEYRSYLRNGGTQTYTETNGSPSVAPSVSDGIVIWTDSTFASSDSNNQPSRYDIFVGKHKNIKIETFDLAGRTGQVDISCYALGASGTAAVYGVHFVYDPTTGIVTVAQNTAGPGTPVSLVMGTNGLSVGVVSPIYFDLVISENALLVGVQKPFFTEDIAHLKYYPVASETFAATNTFQARIIGALENPLNVNWISLASNQFTLQPGTYEIDADCPASGENDTETAHLARLRNVTDSTNTLIGTGGYSSLLVVGATSGGSPCDTYSTISGIFTIAATKVFEIQHASSNNGSGATLGHSLTGFGVTAATLSARIKRIR